jgi:hypothetical protein
MALTGRELRRVQTARAADAGIDNAEKDGSRSEPLGIGRQQVSRRLGIADRRISEEINQGHARRLLNECDNAAASYRGALEADWNV